MTDLNLIVYSIIELGCLLELSKCLNGAKRENNIKSYTLMCVMLLISAYINIFNGSRSLQFFQFICFAGVLKYGNSMKLLDSIAVSILCFMLVGILELLIYIPCNILYSILNFQSDCSICVVILTLLMCHVIEKITFSKEHRKWLALYRNSLDKNIFGVFILITFVFLGSILKFDMGMTLGNGVCLAVLMIVFFVLIYVLCRHQIEIEWHRKYAEKYGEIVTDIRARQHKFANQLNSIYSLHKIYDNYDDLVEHQILELNLLKGYLMPNKVLILDRPLAAAHIYNKLYEAEERGIRLNTDFSCSIQNLDIPDIFLVEIIGNLLDNAMDEVQMRKKNEEICFKISFIDEKVCISVSNEHDKIPYNTYSQFFDKGYSQKGENRGLGLLYVKKIVRKYNGYIEIGNIKRSQKNYFEIRIYL